MYLENICGFEICSSKTFNTRHELIHHVEYFHLIRRKYNNNNSSNNNVLNINNNSFNNSDLNMYINNNNESNNVHDIYQININLINQNFNKIEKLKPLSILNEVSNNTKFQMYMQLLYIFDKNFATEKLYRDLYFAFISKNGLEGMNNF